MQLRYREMEAAIEKKGRVPFSNSEELPRQIRSRSSFLIHSIILFPFWNFDLFAWPIAVWGSRGEGLNPASVSRIRMINEILSWMEMR